MTTAARAIPTWSRRRPRIANWVAEIRDRTSDVREVTLRHRIDMLIEHLVAEDERDVPRTMRTIASTGRYHSWGGAKSYTASAAEQEQIYTDLLDAWPESFQLELEIDRLIVGEDGIAMDGVLHKEVSGEALLGMGFAIPPGCSVSQRFVVSRRQALFVSYHGELMAGEDLYRDEGGVVTLLTVGE